MAIDNQSYVCYNKHMSTLPKSKMYPHKRKPLRDKNVGHIDYRDDFDFPDSGVYFHWWNQLGVGPHDHNHYEVFIITEGSTLHTHNGETELLTKGCLMLINPEDIHMFRPPPDKSRSAHSQHINLSFIPSVLDGICALSPGLAQFLRTKPAHLHTYLSETQLDYFVSNAKQISLLRGPQETIKQAITLITIEMIVEALSILYKSGLNVNPQYPAWFNQLIQKLNEPEALAYTIKDIYSMSHYSPPMLLKYFKEFTGETIVSYFTKIKMKFACNLLRTTNFSVLEISNRVYFDSISHFNRLFKNYTGMTPTEYRKSSL